MDDLFGTLAAAPIVLLIYVWMAYGGDAAGQLFLLYLFVAFLIWLAFAAIPSGDSKKPTYTPQTEIFEHEERMARLAHTNTMELQLLQQQFQAKLAEANAILQSSLLDRQLRHDTWKVSIQSCVNLLAEMNRMDERKPGFLEAFTNDISGITAIIAQLMTKAAQEGVPEEEQERLTTMANAFAGLIQPRIMLYGKTKS